MSDRHFRVTDDATAPPVNTERAWRGEVQSQFSDSVNNARTQSSADRSARQTAAQESGFVDLSAPIFPTETSLASRANAYDRAGTVASLHGSSESRVRHMDTPIKHGDQPKVQGEDAATPPRDYKREYEALRPEQRFVGIPESHGSHSNEDAFAASLKEFKKNGGTAVGMEFVNKDQMKDIDEYSKLLRAQMKGDHSHDDELRERRKKIVEQLSQQFDADTTGDPSRPEAHKNAEHLMKIIDAAVQNDLRIIPLEPNVHGMFRDGAGFNDMRKRASDLSQTDEGRDALKKMMSADPAERAAAAKALKGLMNHDQASPEEQKRQQEFLNNLETMRSSNPPVDTEAFKKAIDAKKGDKDNNELTNVIQNYRNKVWAARLGEYAQTNDGKIAILAGANHFPTDKKSGVAKELEDQSPGSVAVI